MAVMLIGASPSAGLGQENLPAPAEAAGPQSPLDGMPIRNLQIVGLQRIDEAYVRNQIRSEAGKPYLQDQVQKDRSTLLKTNRFLDVKAEPKIVDGQIDLVFTLAEKPEVESIEFVGNKEFKNKDLFGELSFNVGDPLDLFDVRQGRDNIERRYKEKGYGFVEVTYDEELLRTERRVVYTVIENQRVRVRKVEFEGSVSFTRRELLHEVGTKPYIPIFRTGDFDPDRAERDARTVQAYYRDRGWLDAEASYVAEFIDVARESIKVTFRINEGVRYTVQEIRIQGNQVLLEESILALMHLKVGDYLVKSIREGDEERIKTEYGRNGYIDVRVGTSWVFSTEAGQVVVTLAIEEGGQFEIGWIEVNGNFHTQEKCVRRELKFYPEEIFDVTKIRDAEKKLKNTGLFSEASIQWIDPPEGTPGVRDVIVNVVENERTNQFIAGIGASSDNGLMGNLVLENTNFDLFDQPRSWGEFFRGRAFRGAGQTMRVQFEPGTEMTQFRIDFREPYLMDKPIGFGTSLYLFDRGRDGYDERRYGGNFSFDRRFEDGWLAGWAGEIAFRAEYIDVRNREAFAAEDIRDVEGGNYLSSVKLSLLHDTTDSRFDPSEGHLFRASWEQAGAMGGDFFFSEASSSYAQHWTLAIDDQDRKTVVTAHGRVGQIFGDAPVFERFYAGGIGSMRGFDFRGISPRDGLRNNRIGGDFMLLTGAEYTFPLYAKVIRGVFFLDMGTVERDFGINHWRAAVGGGVRLTLDIFGSVPMEFDLALPVSKASEDDTRIFSFFIGLPFF